MGATAERPAATVRASPSRTDARAERPSGSGMGVGEQADSEE